MSQIICIKVLTLSFERSMSSTYRFNKFREIQVNFDDFYSVFTLSRKPKQNKKLLFSKIVKLII